MALSELEKRVLEYVSEHGVLRSEKKIAKELRISPSTYSYILRKLEKEKVILGYKYRVDGRYLDIKQMAWVFLGLRLKGIDVEQTIENLISFPPVRVCAFVTGRNDLAIKIIGKCLEEITNFILTLQRTLGDNIQTTSTYFVTKNFKQHDILMSPKIKDIPIKDVDREMIKLKLENSALTATQIAKTLKLHRNTVTLRWKELLRNRVILKKSAVINPDYYSAVKKQLKSLLMLDVMPGKAEEVAEKISKFHETHEVNIIAPANSVMAIVKTENIDTYFKFLSRFFRDPYFHKIVFGMNSNIVLKSKPNKSALFFD